MNLPRLQALIAPFATPAGPAVFLANEFYTAAIKAEIPYFIAIITAIVTIFGVELSGALMCYCAVESWRRQSWIAMVLAILGAFIYASIVAGGFYLMPKDRGQVFGVMILLTLVAYLGYGLYQSFQEQDKAIVIGSQKEQTDKELEIKRLREEKNLTNALTRKAKAELLQVPDSLFVRPERTGEQGEQNTVRDRVFAYLAEHPNAGPREVQRSVGCSVSTASKWTNQWRANKWPQNSR